MALLYSQVANLVEWQTAPSLRYPNITICNPKYFDVRKMESEYHKESISTITKILKHFAFRVQHFRGPGQLHGHVS